ncbi:hypothetical protein LINPERPRIM_LOCUS7475 [Linum perenne]
MTFPSFKNLLFES